MALRRKVTAPGIGVSSSISEEGEEFGEDASTQWRFLASCLRETICEQEESLRIKDLREQMELEKCGGAAAA